MPRTWSTSIVTHFDKRAFSTSQHKVPILTDISISQEFFPGTTCTSSSAAPLSSLNRNGTVSFHSRRIHFQSKDSMSQAILTTRSSTRERVKEPSTRLEKGIFFPGIRLVYSSGQEVDTVRNCLLLLWSVCEGVCVFGGDQGKGMPESVSFEHSAPLFTLFRKNCLADNVFCRPLFNNLKRLYPSFDFPTVLPIRFNLFRFWSWVDDGMGSVHRFMIH